MFGMQIDFWETYVERETSSYYGHYYVTIEHKNGEGMIQLWSIPKDLSKDHKVQVKRTFTRNGRIYCATDQINYSK